MSKYRTLRERWHESCHKSGCQRLLQGGERCPAGECAVLTTAVPSPAVNTRAKPQRKKPNLE